MDYNDYDIEVLRHQVKQGAGWFYWITGLSLVNAGLSMAGTDVHFIIGSSLMDIAAATAQQLPIVGSVMLLLVIGLYAGLGYKASQAARWAFIAGMIIYLLDGIIYFIGEDVLSGLFHLYALYRMYGGLQAAGQLQAHEQERQNRWPASSDGGTRTTVADLYPERPSSPTDTTAE